jgi:hypothetical protein
MGTVRGQYWAGEVRRWPVAAVLAAAAFAYGGVRGRERLAGPRARRGPARRAAGNGDGASKMEGPHAALASTIPRFRHHRGDQRAGSRDPLAWLDRRQVNVQTRLPTPRRAATMAHRVRPLVLSHDHWCQPRRFVR